MNTEISKRYFLIAVGHGLTTIPILFICFGIPILAFNLLFQMLWYKIIIAFSLCLLGMVVSWFLWSLIIPKWRIWAFKRTAEDYWIELYELAVANKLIWEMGSIFESTEIRSEKEELIIKQIR